MAVRRSKLYTGVLRRCGCPDNASSCQHWGYAIELPEREGKRQYVTKSGFASQKAAAAARAEIVKSHSDGTLADDQKLTVGAWLERWLRLRENDAEEPLAAGTALAYRQHCRDYFIPRIGHMRLRDLRRDHVSEMFAEIVSDRQAELAEFDADPIAWRRRRISEAEKAAKARGQTYDHKRHIPKPRALSVASLRRFRACLSSALSDAVDSGLLSANPASGVRLRKGKAQTPQRQVKAWSAAQLASFLDRSREDCDLALHVGFALAGTLGLRRSEVCGLRWQDIDLDAGKLTIAATRTSVGYAIVHGEGKTEASRAVIDLGASTVGLLKIWRRRQAEQRLSLGEAWGADDLVITREDGVPYHPDRVSKTFGNLVRAYGLPEISLHGLRHTAASVAIEHGVNIEIVSKRLRHTDSKLTSGVYAHLVGDAGKHAADTIESAIFGAAEK